MQYKEVIGATTHIDSSGERLTREELAEFLASTDGRMVPIFSQHDHALPPVGRQLRSELRQLGDGEWAIVALWQVWEPGDEHPGADKDGRAIAIRELLVDERAVSVDASLETPEFLDDLAAIEKLGFRIKSERRKAFDPISVLLIMGGIVGTAFLAEIGKDAWTALRDRIKSIRERKPEAAKRVVFSITVHGQRPVEVNVILDDPNPEQVDLLFSEGFRRIDEALARLGQDDQIARAAFRGDDPEFPLLYTVDSHGFPSRVEALDWNSIGGASINFSRDLTQVRPGSSKAGQRPPD